MNRLVRLAICWFTASGYISPLQAYDHEHLDPSAMDPYEYVIRDHATFLNELSNRRRVNTFFQNEQSPFYGLQIGYVNSSRGNLTFLRRDLVTVGRIPIVFGRIYDSLNRTNADFGPGWKVSLVESISRLSDGSLSYMDDSGSERVYVLQGGTYVPRVPGPSDIRSIEVRDDGLRLLTVSGWSKQFQRRGESLVLTRILDSYGNTLVLQYEGARLVRIESQNNRFVAIERDAKGRISRVYDDQGRSVTYLFDENGLLRTVSDMAGNEWRYEYDALGRLQLAVDPQGVQILQVQSDSLHRALAVRVLGMEKGYRYDDERTAIRDETGRTAFILHNRFGMATTVTSTTGFASEVRLDSLNRVTVLRQNFQPRAEFAYGANGQLETLTRFDQTGPVTLNYHYDPSGQISQITGSDGSSLTLVFNQARDLLRRQDGDHWDQYEYSQLGDLQIVANNYGSTSYTHNEDGQIETISRLADATSLTYFPNGRLKSIAFADGSLHEFRYNALGLRQSVERSNDVDIAYWYDPAGNLIRSIGFDASGRNIGQAFDIDSFYRAKTVEHDSGAVTIVTYDAVGNPETISNSKDPSQPVLNYTYDSRNRLLAVASGEKIIGSYVYDGTEADLRDQLDYHTMRVANSGIRHSATVGSIDAVFYTRPYGSTFGFVGFDETTQSLGLASDIGLVLPDLIRGNSILRQELSGVEKGSVNARVKFDRPSNITFTPAEYATINCAQNCVFYGIDVRVNGSYTPISVPFGSTVALAAGSPQGTTNTGCQLLLCAWYDNGVYIGAGKFRDHTLTTAGSHEIGANCECSPCDLTGSDSVAVEVLPCSSGISLVTQTYATVPSNRSRKTIGVGEKVKLTLNPAPPCAVTWSKTGTGTLSATTGNTIDFTAPGKAGTTTVKASMAGSVKQVEFTIVEPQSESALKIEESVISPGVAGAGMTLQITIAPTTVSFQNVESREVPGPATNVTGYFQQFSASQLYHNTSGWVQITSGNLKFDVAATSGLPSPWSAGGFQWVIPIEWRVVNGSYVGTLPNRTQTFSITNNGTVTVSKMGQSVTRSP